MPAPSTVTGKPTTKNVEFRKLSPLRFTRRDAKYNKANIYYWKYRRLAKCTAVRVIYTHRTNTQQMGITRARLCKSSPSRNVPIEGAHLDSPREGLSYIWIYFITITSICSVGTYFIQVPNAKFLYFRASFHQWFLHVHFTGTEIKILLICSLRALIFISICL